MAPANLELVERLYERWNAHDLEGGLLMHHPEFEMVSSGTFPDLEPVYEGSDGFTRFWNSFYGTWERLTIITREVFHNGDQVVALLDLDGEGRDGVRVHGEAGHVLTFRDGLVARLDVYAGWEAARAATGQAS